MLKTIHARGAITALVTFFGFGLPSPGAHETSHNVITYTGLEAALTLTDDPRGGGNRIASLLVDTALFGSALLGLAGFSRRRSRV